MEETQDYEMLGVPLYGTPRPYPGLAPVAHKLDTLKREVADLEKQSYELKQVRATLLLNYHEDGGRALGIYGVNESKSTIELLLNVLNGGYFGTSGTSQPLGAKKEEEKK